MGEPKERLTSAISTAELERRWSQIRNMMNERKVDYLVMRNDKEDFGGYVKWFTDIPAQGFGSTVIFPVDEEMTLISPGPRPPYDPGPPPWAVRGVKTRLGAPYFPSTYFTGTYDAELAVGVLGERKQPTIGILGKSTMCVAFFEYLNDHLPSARFLDLSDDVDRVKVIKSSEEIELIKQTAQLQDEVMEYVRKAIRPGRREYEVYAEALYHSNILGSENQLVLVGSGPSDGPVPFCPRYLQNRVMKEGDQVSVLVEVSGPGGQFTELGRIFSIGDPSPELQDAFGIAVEAQKVSLDLLKPGADPGDIMKANNEFLESKGYFPEARLYAHGQGYDLVERPLIRDDEPMKIHAGMNITIHPTAANKKVWAGVTDNYLVTESGVGECLHKTPKEIIIV